MRLNKGTGVSVDDSFSMLDVKLGHCTIRQFKGRVDPAMNPVKIFTAQNMRAKAPLSLSLRSPLCSQCSLPRDFWGLSDHA